MPKLHPEVKKLLSEIETYRARTGESRSGFGRAFANDSHFIDRLMTGRVPTLETIDRVRSFMAARSNAVAKSINGMRTEMAANLTTLWTEEVIEAFCLLCGGEEQLTYKEIANRLSAQFNIQITKNSCIGKARRLNIPFRIASYHHHIEPIRVAPPVPVEAPITPPLPRHRPSHGMTIEQLRHDSCRYPEGIRPPYSYCGRKTKDGSSWCNQHKKVVFNHGLHSRH